MFCSACGTKADGKFCWSCGAALHGGGPTAAGGLRVVTETAVAESEAPPTAGDWSDEVRYEVLIRHPEVRDRIAGHAKLARKRLSAEEFLAAGEKLISSPVPITGLLEAVFPMYERLGIRSKKARSERVGRPAGLVLVSALCSMARQGVQPVGVEQAEDGCCIQAALPSTMWVYKGEMVLTVRREVAGTLVEAATCAKGQLYDWGQGRSFLDTLFEDLRKVPA